MQDIFHCTQPNYGEFFNIVHSEVLVNEAGEQERHIYRIETGPHCRENILVDPQATRPGDGL